MRINGGIKMYKLKTLNCEHCKSVMVNLPESELQKLNGLNFQCENCGNQNLLLDFKFHKPIHNDPLLNIFNSILNFVEDDRAIQPT